MTNKIHEGRNIKRFREMLGVKQEALAFELGDDWSQKKISLLESKETVDPTLLQQISSALKIPVEAFQNFDEDAAVSLISCTFSGNAIAHSTNYGTMNFNPVEKLLELHEQRIALYERMLKEKEEMMGELKKLIPSN
jgi:transcriptional regulator with XRE-family HTH domain